MAQQGYPHMNILCATLKETWRLLSFQVMVVKICGGDWCRRCETSKAFPPLPLWESILAMDIRELRIMASADMDREIDDL